MKRLGALAFAMSLAGCGGGGGSGEEPAPEALLQRAAAAPAPRMQAMAIPLGADPAAGANKLFTFAEAQASLRSYFPRNEPTRSMGSWFYRYYPQSGVYLAVINWRVYVMGGAFGAEVVDVGPVDAYITVDGPATPSPPPPAPPPAARSGIDALIGNVTFTYQFTSGGQSFKDTVTFRTSDRVGNGVAARLTSASALTMACLYDAAAPIQGYHYFCSYEYASGSINDFLFNVSNGVISGKYNYCPATQSDSACTSDLLTKPDAVLHGTVVPGPLSQPGSAPQTFDLPDEAAKLHLKARRQASGAPLVEPVQMPALLAVREALQAARKRREAER